MYSICGTGCCEICGRKEECPGCCETQGHPFGVVCVAAEAVRKGGPDAFSALKSALIREFNSLAVPHLTVTDLNLLSGSYVNIEYPLANGQSVRLLDDNKIYLGNQIEVPGSDRCYGIVADEQYLLVCSYGCEGADPEIILYKKRQMSVPGTENGG